jgi:hypothetical protein
MEIHEDKLIENLIATIKTPGDNVLWTVEDIIRDLGQRFQEDVRRTEESHQRLLKHGKSEIVGYEEQTGDYGGSSGDYGQITVGVPVYGEVPFTPDEIRAEEVKHRERMTQLTRTWEELLGALDNLVGRPFHEAFAFVLSAYVSAKYPYQATKALREACTTAVLKLSPEIQHLSQQHQEKQMEVDAEDSSFSLGRALHRFIGSLSAAQSALKQTNVDLGIAKRKLTGYCFLKCLCEALCARRHG